MRLYYYEDGTENELTKGNFEEIREFLVVNLDQLINFLDNSEDNNEWDEENGMWKDFEEFKEELREDIDTCKDVEEIRETLKYTNSLISWWGLFIEEDE